MRNNYSNLKNTWLSEDRSPNLYNDPLIYGNYISTKSNSGHDCWRTTATSTCANPGHGICSYSNTQCIVDDKTCFGSKEACELVTNCDQDYGWEKNLDSTDCNIYKCTKDGSKYNKGNPFKNADNLYNYSIYRPQTPDPNSSYRGDTAFCWRKGIGNPEPDIEQYCREGLTSCYFEGLPDDKAGTKNDGWGGYDCFGNNGVCVASLTDTSTKVKQSTECTADNNHDCPYYMYPSSERGISFGQYTNCWRQAPEIQDNSKIHFFTWSGETPNSYPVEGISNTDRCINSKNPP